VDLGPYGVDGEFGDDTEAALRAFQKKAGVDQSGVYDAKTREAAEGYLSLARTALDAVPDAKERGILLQMADYVRDRKK